MKPRFRPPAGGSTSLLYPQASLFDFTETPEEPRGLKTSSPADITHKRNRLVRQRSHAVTRDMRGHEALSGMNLRWSDHPRNQFLLELRFILRTETRQRDCSMFPTPKTHQQNFSKSCFILKIESSIKVEIIHIYNLVNFLLQMYNICASVPL